jgi:hypothetical protein
MVLGDALLYPQVNKLLLKDNMAALAKALAEQWQRWVRQQSTKKWQQL